MVDFTNRCGQITGNVEKALPVIIAISSVVVVIFVPLSISNSHTIHMPGM